MFFIDEAAPFLGMDKRLVVIITLFVLYIYWKNAKS